MENHKNLTVHVEDERYPVHVTVGEADKFTLYFNPGDPFLGDYAKNLRDVEWDEDDYDKFISTIEENFDGIFGKGSARLICRHMGVKLSIISALLSKVEEGQADFKERAKDVDSQEKINELINAKKNAAPYVAPQ